MEGFASSSHAQWLSILRRVQILGNRCETHAQYLAADDLSVRTNDTRMLRLL